MKIRELLTDESKWIKGCFAQDKRGEPVGTNSFGAVSWCLIGAVEKCYPDREENTRIRYKIINHLRKFDLGDVEFNDNRNTTFEKIRTLVETLDI